MSEDKIEKALARIAQLEAEVARSRTAAKPAPQFDQAAFARQFASDPIGTMTKMGVPIDHTTRVLVAHALGDQAPPELKVLAAMGPQVSATSALTSSVEQMRQRLDAYEVKERRQSFQALATDKQKYPHLSKAIAVDPSITEGFSGDNADEYASTMEARLAKMVQALSPAASTNADTQVQSTQNQAQVTTGNPTSGDPTPPPIPQNKPGVWSEDEHRRLRDEVVRKHSRPATEA